jgi:protein phosphatase
MALRLETASITDKGLNPQKPVNEDSYLVLPSARIFAVADGVGGAHAGNVASKAVLETIEKTVSEGQDRRHNSDSISYLHRLIQAGNAVVCDLGEHHNHLMASTIAIMLIEDEYAILGHVGDSRIYLFRNNGLIQLTTDHSKIEAQSGQENDIAVEDHPERNVITQALGVESVIGPAMEKVILKDGDIFVLCTDGIYTNNSAEQIKQNLQQNGHNLDLVCQTFKDNCYKGGAKDHLTAVVISVNPAKP